MSAAVFAAQHLYLIATVGWTVGLASVILTALLLLHMAVVLFSLYLLFIPGLTGLPGFGVRPPRRRSGAVG